MRWLLLVLILPIFAASAFAQTPTNPPVAACGLPAEGTIVSTVEYTLTANCTQTRFLEIKTAETPNITLTINGGGYTITNMTDCCELNSSYNSNFLLVDDQGEMTVQNVDNGRSPNVKVIINNVTFDGNNKRFRRPRRLQPDNVVRLSATGAGILVDGDLTMENVTFTRGNGIWVRAKGTATLKNVLFEDSWVPNFGFSSTIKGMLHVAKSGSVTLNNAVFRDTARVVIAIDKGGSLSTAGCLSFVRVWTHKAHHSGVYGGFGTWSDSSTGACTGGIGNGGQAVVAYTLPTLPCSLPSDGSIEGTVVYTLTQPCVCVNTVNIAAGAHVTINANGNRIEGCSSGSPQFRIGNAQVTINNAVISGIRVRNYGGTFTLKDSIVTQTRPTPIINYGWAFLLDSLFEENTGYGDGEGKVYYAHGYFGMGRALFQDNIFRNNLPADDEIEAYTTGSSTAIYLCGDNVLDGDIPTSIARFLMAEEGGRILGCDAPTATPASTVQFCQPEKINPPIRRTLGAIGVILHMQTCPDVIEIWEVMSNSHGKFALEVSQDDVDARGAGLVACSPNGRAAVRVGLTEPVRQKIVHSRAYQAVSPRLAPDILISLGPNAEGKVNHLVIDNVLGGQVLGTVDTLTDEPPCQASDLSGLLAAAAAPQPTPIPYAAAVAPQPARDDGSIVHVVRPGDTVWQIGIAYDVHPYDIIALNQLDQLRNRGHYIHPGQELIIREAE